MTEGQKNSVWQRIQTKEAEKERAAWSKVPFSARAAVCAGVLLVSGMTALAAGEFSVMDRIAEAIALVIKGGEEKVSEARAIVQTLTDKYPLI